MVMLAYSREFALGKTSNVRKHSVSAMPSALRFW
jgi:hypothetical protein